MEPVIDELVEMFEKGVPDVCFEHSRGLLFGEKTKGYTGCVECLDDTNAVYLPNNSKIVYMGHRRFLPKDHPYHRNRKDFDRTIEKCPPPKYRDRPAILREVNKLDVVLGKGHYYILTYHYRHFHCRSDRSDGVILAPSRPPRTKTGSSDFYHRQVNNRYGSGIGVAFPPSHEKLGRLGYAFCPPALKALVGFWLIDETYLD